MHPWRMHQLQQPACQPKIHTRQIKTKTNSATTADMQFQFMLQVESRAKQSIEYATDNTTDYCITEHTYSKTMNTKTQRLGPGAFVRHWRSIFFMVVYFTTVCHLHLGVLMACSDLFTLMKTGTSHLPTRIPPLAHRDGCLRRKVTTVRESCRRHVRPPVPGSFRHIPVPLWSMARSQVSCQGAVEAITPGL